MSRTARRSSSVCGSCRTKRSPSRSELLMKLKSRRTLTNHQRVSLLSAHGLDGAMEKLAKELRSQYKVVYSRPESLIPPDKVTVSAGKPGLTVRGAEARGENGA